LIPCKIKYKFAMRVEPQRILWELTHGIMEGLKDDDAVDNCANQRPNIQCPEPRTVKLDYFVNSCWALRVRIVEGLARVHGGRENHC